MPNVYESPNQPERKSASTGSRPNSTLLMTKILPIAILALVAGSGMTSAQTPSATVAPTPCANDAERRRFDFWIGEWDVTTKSGAPQGKSVIQSVSGGCALLEELDEREGRKRQESQCLQSTIPSVAAVLDRPGWSCIRVPQQPFRWEESRVHQQERDQA